MVSHRVSGAAFGQANVFARNFCGMLLAWWVCSFQLAYAQAPAELPPTNLTFCFEDASIAPWRNPQAQGLNFELLQKVSQTLGLPFEYMPLPWKRCLAKLKAQEVDGAIGASFSEERLEIGAYPGGNPADPAKRLHIDRFVALKLKGSPLQWDGKQFTPLQGSVGVQLGYSIAGLLRQNGMLVDEGSKTLDNLIQKLIAGRVDVVAIGGSDAEALMAPGSRYAARLEMLPTPLSEKAFYLVLSHGVVERHPAMAQRIWKTVETVRQSPAYRKKERSALAALNR